MRPNDINRRLAAALDAVGYPPSTVEMARNGHWSDFASPLAMPKMALNAMLMGDGHEELAQRVRDGEFDG